MSASGASPTLVLENVVMYADPDLKLAMMAMYDPTQPGPRQQAREIVNWAETLLDEGKMYKSVGRETVSAVTQGRKCYKCHEVGHLRRDYPLRQQKIEDSTARNTKWALATPTQVPMSHDWILDSGASRHMVNDERLLKTML
ncbi:unnamed protein product [Phytophthora fragariaefolia]|uniref:Unnamed protein product n=1 Tax=Phytophthora fragariaefolia TaxID=1490495 RepID=A0A9W7D7P1_9STRA|nr:unnamed protein product [Phytophthora fragariaefolia]